MSESMCGKEGGDLCGTVLACFGCVKYHGAYFKEMRSQENGFTFSVNIMYLLHAWGNIEMDKAHLYAKD